jgi:hypothetical protein
MTEMGYFMKRVFILAVALLSACAEQSAMRLASDMVRINVSTAPIYGALEPERRMMAMAAQETVKNGYDSFLIVDGQSGFHQNTLGVSPGYAYGSGGSFHAQGPSTVAMPRFQTAVTIKMFRVGDPAGARAINAREILRQQS